MISSIEITKFPPWTNEVKDDITLLNKSQLYVTR